MEKAWKGRVCRKEAFRDPVVRREQEAAEDGPGRCAGESGNRVSLCRKRPLACQAVFDSR